MTSPGHHITNKRPEPLRFEGDNDYILEAKTGKDVWIGIGPISVCVHVTDEGVVVDFWPNHNEADAPFSLASAYAFFQEAEEAGGTPCDTAHPETL